MRTDVPRWWGLHFSPYKWSNFGHFLTVLCKILQVSDSSSRKNAYWDDNVDYEVMFRQERLKRLLVLSLSLQTRVVLVWSQPGETGGDKHPFEGVAGFSLVTSKRLFRSVLPFARGTFCHFNVQSWVVVTLQRLLHIGTCTASSLSAGPWNDICPNCLHILQCVCYLAEQCMTPTPLLFNFTDDYTSTAVLFPSLSHLVQYLLYFYYLKTLIRLQKEDKTNIQYCSIYIYICIYILHHTKSWVAETVIANKT